MDTARNLHPTLIEKDADISEIKQAEQQLQEAHNSLKDVREQYNMPAECS